MFLDFQDALMPHFLYSSGSGYTKIIDVVNTDCSTTVSLSRVGGCRNGTEVELQSSLSLTAIKKLDDTHTSSSLTNTYLLFSLDNKSNLI